MRYILFNFNHFIYQNFNQVFLDFKTPTNSFKYILFIGKMNYYQKFYSIKLNHFDDMFELNFTCILLFNKESEIICYI